MPQEPENQTAILGRTEHDLQKYADKGTAYLGKVVMSSGENPVLGRKVLIDVAKPHMMLICGKRGGGKCLSGDTLITLADGSLIEIKDLEYDSRQILSLNHEYKIKTAKKDEFFKRPTDKLLEIELRSGKKIKLTPEHPLLTIDGWKPAQELAIGRRIATPREQAIFGNEFMRECEVKLIAYLIAEGHTARKAVWFCNSDEKIINDFMLAVNEFDPNMTVKPGSGWNWRAVSRNPEQKIVKAVRKNGKFAKGTIFEPMNTLRANMRALGIYDLLSHDKYTPQKIIKLPKQKLSLFLNRLFSCDGSIYFESNRTRISYASVSEKLIRQVHHLLLRFGILSRIRNKKSRCNGKEFPSFEIVIEGENVQKFLTEIGFYGEKEKRQERALLEFRSVKRNPNLDTIPKEIWGTYRPKSWTEIGKSFNYAHPKALRESMHYAPSRQKLLQIAKTDDNKLVEMLATSDIYWDEIKKINKLEGIFEVYDISVPENHNFVANDIIVHNSYSMAVLIEEMARQPIEIRSRISVIVIDTVGIFWSMKLPTKAYVDELEKWDLKAEGTQARVLVPKGVYDFYKKKEMPVDGSFTIRVCELDSAEWMSLFRVTWKDAEGVLISRIIETAKQKLGTFYGLDDLVTAAKNDTESEKSTRDAVAGRFAAAKSWGLFEKEGTRIKDIAKPGMITVIDVSTYRQASGMEGTRDIIVGLIGKRLFEERMLYRKEEEIRLTKGLSRESDLPIIWLFIDEAHMFMPKDEESFALSVLLEWVRVGRQPGLSLVLATQRPNKLHPDCISQCDMFISHRMTAQPDIEAVAQLRPSYMHQDFGKYYQEMPRGKGFAVILDDESEKLWLVKIRPRFSWDAGITATAFRD